MWSSKVNTSSLRPPPSNTLRIGSQGSSSSSQQQQQQELIRPAPKKRDEPKPEPPSRQDISQDYDDNEQPEGDREGYEQDTRPSSLSGRPPPSHTSTHQHPHQHPHSHQHPQQPQQAQVVSSVSGPVSSASVASRKPVAPPKAPVKIEAVQIESLVMIQIVKHCAQESFVVSGYLLGLQTGKLLEITNSFPAIRDNIAYKDEMLKLMAETRDDSNLVGWYRSINHGLYLEDNTIALQYTHQLENPSSVCIIYDPFATTKGRLSIKAIRLTDRFMKFYEGNEHGSSKIAELGLTSKDVVEELPIKIHNYHMVHAFLFELQNKSPLNCSFERLHQSHEYQLLDTLRQLSNAIDDYEIQTIAFRTYHSKSMKNKAMRDELMQKYMNESKSRSRGLRTKPPPELDKLFPKEPEPSRLQVLTLIAQMSQYSEEIDSSVMQGLTKLWVTQGLHQDKPLTQ